jgi:5'-phosphate synthase pdxT subunit
MTKKLDNLVIGVLALQGAFSEHVQLLREAAQFELGGGFEVIEVRTEAELNRCNALVIPGGESTTISLVAERSKLLEPLRAFVK